VLNPVIDHADDGWNGYRPDKAFFEAGSEKRPLPPASIGLDRTRIVFFIFIF